MDKQHITYFTKAVRLSIFLLSLALPINLIAQTNSNPIIVPILPLLLDEPASLNLTNSGISKKCGIIGDNNLSGYTEIINQSGTTILISNVRAFVAGVDASNTLLIRDPAGDYDFSNDELNVIQGEKFAILTVLHSAVTCPSELLFEVDIFFTTSLGEHRVCDGICAE